MPHERFRDLAATALDFDLEPSERAELDAHLEECADCRTWADALRRDEAWLRALPAPGAPERVRRAVVGGRPGRRGTSQRFGLVVAILVLVLLPIGSAAVLLRGLDLGLGIGAGAASGPPTSAWVMVSGGVPGETPSSPAEASAAPTLPPATSAAESGAPGLPTADIQGLAAVSWSPAFGYVAVGDACPSGGDPCAAAVVVSADGTAWARVDVPALGLEPLAGSDRAGMHDITVLDKRIVAVGSGASGGSPQAAFWWSDTGSDWTRQPYAASTAGWANAVVVLDSGRAVAVGGAMSDGAARAVAWTSEDGQVWQRSPDAPSLDVGVAAIRHDGRPLAGMLDVASDGRQLVAVGARCDGPDGPCSGVAWTSPDGVGWTVVARPFGDGLASAIAVVDGQLVAVGRNADLPAAWTSADGRVWQSIPVDDVPGAELRTVIGINGAVVAGGLIDGSSATGSIWAAEKGLLTLTARDGVFAGASVDGLVAVGKTGAAGTTVIAVGRGAPGELGTIWRRELQPGDQP